MNINKELWKVAEAALIAAHFVQPVKCGAKSSE
jgi:hypothetical protein